jgi:hypothetical protein
VGSTAIATARSQRIGCRRFAQNGDVGRVVVSDDAVKHENNFVAKIRDSESAQREFHAPRRVATRVAATIARNS